MRAQQKNMVDDNVDGCIHSNDRDRSIVVRAPQKANRPRKIRPSSPRTSALVDDMASESTNSSRDSSTESESDTESEPDSQDETTHLSPDNMHFVAAEEVDRRESYDSRCEEGNEAYELDGFVVSDGDSDREEDVTGPEEQDNVDEDDEDGDDVHRRNSIYSTSTESSEDTLFISETKRKKTKSLAHTHHYWKTLVLQVNSGAFSRLPLSNTEPEIIAEQITDAVSLFSRRCNRFREPLVLELGRQMMEDEAVCEALVAAGRLGLSRRLNENRLRSRVLGPSERCTVPSWRRCNLARRR